VKHQSERNHPQILVFDVINNLSYEVTKGLLMWKAYGWMSLFRKVKAWLFKKPFLCFSFIVNYHVNSIYKSQIRERLASINVLLMLSKSNHPQTRTFACFDFFNDRMLGSQSRLACWVVHTNQLKIRSINSYTTHFNWQVSRLVWHLIWKLTQINKWFVWPDLHNPLTLLLGLCVFLRIKWVIHKLSKLTRD
jgi:hypothetical protein